MSDDALILLFSDVLDVPAGSLSDDSAPETVSAWDSLAAMHLVAAIEERFDVRLSTRDIMKMNTIGRARAALRDKGVEI